MTYPEAIAFINSRLKFGVKPGLEHTRELLARLGDPHKKCEFVHIAGTNGKGSACAMIAAGLRERCKAVGLYTSPYIRDFRERFQINGEMITKNELAELTGRVASVCADMEELTEFELITCVAFLWFAERACDIVVLETGLGGRLDSTNVIENPLCCAITRIDYDHMGVLGNTIAEIAGEKAGIIKPGCPVVVSADQHPEALAVLQSKAAEMAAPLMLEPPSDELEASIFGSKAMCKGVQLYIPFAGEHQLANAAVAMGVLRVLGLSDADIAAGIAKATIPARLEIISRNPLTILDGAHNENGANALARTVRWHLAGRKIVGVMGILADKQADRMIKTLAPLFEKIYTVDGFSPREITAELLAGMAAPFCPADAAESPCKAVQLARQDAAVFGGQGAVIVCGSLYLMGKIPCR